MHKSTQFAVSCTLLLLAGVLGIADDRKPASTIGQERAIPHHLQDDDEFTTPLKDLLAYGRKLFIANWTDQDGGGRPLTKGNGIAFSDPSKPLSGSRAFNRLSGPDANSCYGCHNMPYGIPGGGGECHRACCEPAQNNRDVWRRVSGDAGPSND